MREELNQQFEQAKALGKTEQALSVLDTALSEVSTENDRRRILDLLTKTCSDQFLHRRALNYAKAHEDIIGLSPVAWVYSLFGAYWICFRFLLGLNPCSWTSCFLFKQILKRKRDLNFDEVTTLLYANYWYSIHKSASYSFLQLELAKSSSQRLMAIGNLAYTLAYSGHGKIGIAVLRKVMRMAEKTQDDRIRGIFYMHLGIAHQMNYQFKESVQTYNRFDTEFSNPPNFFKSIALGNRITANIGLSDLIESDKAIDKAFSYSFALNDSRTHIQVFGFKALLLALEGRVIEAESFISRSLATAAKNDSPLDRTIAHRIACLYYSTLNQWDKVREHLELGLQNCREYGEPFFYLSQLQLIEVLARSGNSKFKLLSYWFKFLSKHFFHPRAFVVSLKLVVRLYLNTNAGLFPRESLTKYFEYRLKAVNVAPDYGILRAITEGAEQVLLEANFNATVEPSKGRLVEQLGKIFKNTKVYIGHSLETLIEKLRQEETVQGFVGATGDCVKAPCEKGFFIGVLAPKAKEVNETLAVGLLLPQLNTFTEAFVESVLRILLSNYIFSLAVHRSRDQVIRDEQTRALGKLTREFAHDIRDPLATIDKLIEATPQAPQAMKDLMRAALKRIQDSASEILVSKSTVQLEKVATQPTNELLSKLIEPLVAEKRALFRDREVKICIDSDKCDYGIFAEVQTTDFQRLLSNIITNAVQATEGKGRVSLHWLRKGQNVILVVEDNGKGIPEHVLPHLGEEQFTFGKADGTGLGLLRAKRVVKSWGGKLNISSKVGMGTKVEISLPISKAPSWFLSQLNLECGTTLVVLDDEPFAVEVWRHLLKFYLDQNIIKLTSFRNSSDFKDWHSKISSQEKVIYLFDYDLRTERKKGTQVIEECGIQKHAILVTGHANDTDLQNHCRRLGISMISKECILSLPVHYKTQAYIDLREVTVQTSNV